MHIVKTNLSQRFKQIESYRYWHEYAKILRSIVLFVGYANHANNVEIKFYCIVVARANSKLVFTEEMGKATGSPHTKDASFNKEDIYTSEYYIQRFFAFIYILDRVDNGESIYIAFIIENVMEKLTYFIGKMFYFI